MVVSLLQAWYWRGKANASLNGFKDAAHNFNVAMRLEEFLSRKRQIERELKFIMDQYMGIIQWTNMIRWLAHLR